MNALKILQELDYNTKRETYKNMPEFAIPKKTFSDRTANDLTRAVLSFLEIKGHWATRINTTGRMLKGHEYTDVLGHRKQLPGKWIPGTTKNGTADIHSVINGVHCSIEVKIGKDKMSPDQIKTKEAIQRSGGIYFVAKDFESFFKFYHEITSPQ